MDDDLEARLESHAQAFEGLLSLMPAKQYFGEDNSDQWQRKKQTKEEKRAARKAKLDPQNQKSAKDVMDENERKRKRELGLESGDEGEQDEHSPADQEEQENDPRANKKRKVEKGQNMKKDGVADDSSAQNMAKAEKRKEKRERKKEKIERKKDKVEAKKARKQDDDLDQALGEPAAGEEENAEKEDEPAVGGADDVDALDISGLADEDVDDVDAQQLSVPTSPDANSPVFDVSANQSTASSSSSIVPPTIAPSLAKPTTAEQTSTDTITPTDSAHVKKEKAFNLPKIDSDELQSRLRARIEELRARRKADGRDGKPAQSRQELLDERRKKSDTRKQHKKELRLKAKQEEERLNNERLRGSGSPLSADIFSPRSPMTEPNNFSFGRVAFENGQETDPTLNSAVDGKRRKGPQDPKTALESAQRKAARLSGYDETKRADIEQKDLWLNAKKRAHGERIRDDQSLLKKALKRSEKGKAKSEKEWGERTEGVRHGKAMRQKKRDDNLSKRHDDKGGKKGKAKGGAKGPPKGGKKKGRAGFEGKFKA